MLIRVGYDLIFDLPAPTPMVVLLHVHPDRAPTLRKPERLVIEPNVPVEVYTDTFGNTAARFNAPAGQIRLTNDTVVEDSGLPDPVAADAQQHAVQDLPKDTLQFLLGSRYCEVDVMTPLAWDLFNSTPLGWPRVKAICDFVHNHIQFGYEHARSTKTAQDVYYERRGVCRDFMHLAVTFCRCMNIPARYVTGYLGDIGIPPVPCPMDFSAWFEVYLSGRWWAFDARHNVPRIGRVLMARGRDATDVALTTSFGPAILKKFNVWTDEVNGF